MRNHLLTKEPDGVQHLLVLRGPDGAQHEDFLDAQGFIAFEKADALRGRADAEGRAALPHLLRCGLPWVWAGGEALIPGVIALVVGRHGGRIIVTPHQAGTLALLLEIPADELGTT